MRDVVGFEGLYAVTSCGRVWSYKTNKFLKNLNQSDGYLVVNLHKDGKHYTKRIHRLVCEAYVENPNNYTEVSHLDETRIHNWVSNLVWCSHSQNCNMPLYRKRRTKKVKCLMTGIIYNSMKEASKETNIDYDYVRRCCNRQNRQKENRIFEYVV